MQPGIVWRDVMSDRRPPFPFRLVMVNDGYEGSAYPTRKQAVWAIAAMGHNVGLAWKVVDVTKVVAKGGDHMAKGTRVT